jgi:hypothetical protein
MPEMLTIKQTLQKINEQMPNSNIRDCTLRAWIREKKFHYVKAGKKILISWASLVAFLGGSEA